MAQERDKSGAGGGNAENDRGVPLQINPDQLRRIATIIETEFLPSLQDLLDKPMPNVYGDLKVFPRPSTEDQSVTDGVDTLRDLSQKAVLILTTVAVALERQPEVGDVLRRLVGPVIEVVGSNPAGSESRDRQ
jgi:hypothetical protein